MLTIFKNDFQRIKEQKTYLIVGIILTVLSVILAIFMTNNLHPKLNLALVGNQKQIGDNDQINLTLLKEEPPMSSLVKNQYDAIIVYNPDNTYQIKTTKSATFKQQLVNLLKHQSVATNPGRKIGTNIMGYMMMFLLIQGMLYSRLFAEDKEKHLLERIVCSPLNFFKYLIGHALFMLLFVFITPLSVLIIAQLMGIEIGFSLLQYTILIALTSLLSTSFALCINSFFKVSDTANMIGSSLIVLSSVLSGSFYDIGNSSGLIQKLLQFFPQKDLLLFTTAWENNLLVTSSWEQLIYVIIFILGLLAIGIIKTRKDYIYHRRNE